MMFFSKIFLSYFFGGLASEVAANGFFLQKMRFFLLNKGSP